VPFLLTPIPSPVYEVSAKTVTLPDIITVLAECLKDKTNQNSKKFENILLTIQNQHK
jgi:hypothetical protein